MSIKIVAQALGLKADAPEAEVVAAASEHAKLKIQAKADSDYRASVAAVVGKDGDAALGVLAAWRESHDKLPSVQAKLDEIETKGEADRHAALVEKGKADGKLTASLCAYFAPKSADELEAFLAAATKVVPVNEGVTQPRAAGAGADDGEAAPTHEGKTYEALTGPEKVALKASNPELFAQMRAHFNASH